MVTKRKVSDSKKLTIQLLQQKKILAKDYKKYKRVGTVNKKPVFQKKKQVIRHKAVKPIAKPRGEVKGKYYRYSVAYIIGGSYNKSFRAEVYTNKEMNTNTIQSQLQNFINMKVKTMNVGLQKMFSMTSYQGLESEEVGSNDIGISKLNHIYFFFEDFI